MGVLCGICQLLFSFRVLFGLLVVYVLHHLLKAGPRRAPTRPPVSSERKVARGTGKEIVCKSPATGKLLGKRNAYTPAEVEAAIKASRAAQQDWRGVSFDERRAVLMDISDWCLSHMPEIMELSVNDSGKTRAEAVLGEVMTTLEKIRWLVAHGEKHLRREGRPVPTMLATKKAYVEFAPLGVIGIIVPWNYPFHNVLSHVATALLSGNGAVVKVSEYASFSAEPIEDMFRQILARRGHNPDLVQVITGFGETGNALVTRGVDKVLFIGSPGVGKLVMKAAADNLTPCILELGGKDPFIIFGDAQYAHCLDIAIRGAFINCGQNCIAAERFYVHESLYDRFVEDIGRKYKELRQGPSCEGGRTVDFGSITMAPQLEQVKRLVAEAVAAGAKVVGGGKVPEEKDCKEGLFFAPTVLANVTHKMRIANEETFGPVMIVIKFSTEEEVVRMANSTEFGLGSSVFTTDYKKAERVARALECGMCSVNDFGMVPMVGSLPFGGVKSSGFGCFNGKEGLRGFCRQQAVVTDRFPLRMDVPKFLQYPVSGATPDIVQHGMRMVYGKSWLGSIAAFFSMMKTIVKGK